MTSRDDFRSFVREISELDDMDACWSSLCLQMQRFEIDRVFYARKRLADLQSFHNRFRLTWFSTYGPEANKLFVEGGGFVTNHTIRWALDNAGAMSWRATRQRYLSGAMSAQEEEIHLGMRDLGLVAGITYSNPILAHRVRSGFGLCFRPGLEQEDADRIWAEEGSVIVPYLQVFELAASQIRNTPPGHALSERQMEILRLTIDGKTTGEIATLLGIHRRTVEDHLKAARSVLGVSTTLQAAVIATQQGQI